MICPSDFKGPIFQVSAHSFCRADNTARFLKEKANYIVAYAVTLFGFMGVAANRPNVMLESITLRMPLGILKPQGVCKDAGFAQLIGKSGAEMITFETFLLYPCNKLAYG